MPYILKKETFHTDGVGNISYQPIGMPLVLTKGRHLLTLINWRVSVDVDGTRILIHNQNPNQAGQILVPNMIRDANYLVYLRDVMTSVFPLFPDDVFKEHEILRCHSKTQVDTVLWMPE